MLIYNNTASDTSGAIKMHNCTNVTLENLDLAYNTARVGGSFYGLQLFNLTL